MADDIKTPDLFNSNLKSNTGGFTYGSKEKRQSISKNKSNHGDSKVFSTKDQILMSETKDAHIETDIILLNSSKNKTTILIS